MRWNFYTDVYEELPLDLIPCTREIWEKTPIGKNELEYLDELLERIENN